MRLQSSEAETSIFESGLQEISEIPAVWPSKVNSYFPVLACQIFIVLSLANRCDKSANKIKRNTSSSQPVAIRTELDRGDGILVTLQSVSVGVVADLLGGRGDGCRAVGGALINSRLLLIVKVHRVQRFTPWSARQHPNVYENMIKCRPLRPMQCHFYLINNAIITF